MGLLRDENQTIFGIFLNISISYLGPTRLLPAYSPLLPAYFSLTRANTFDNLTATAKIDHTAIKGSGGFIYLGLGLEIADVNHDGITDILLHSENPMGRQVLYGLAP